YRENLVCLRRLNVEDDAVEAGIAIALELVSIFVATEDRDRQLLAGPIRRVDHLPELGQHIEYAVGGPPAVRHPTVAVADRASGTPGELAADEDGRMRLLHGLRPRHHRVEVDELAMLLRLCFGPDRLPGLHPIAHQPVPARE